MEETAVFQFDKDRANVRLKLFWEFDLTQTDWQEHSVAVILRVIERGTRNEWEAIIDYYGKDRVISALIGRCISFPDEIVAEVSEYFNVPFLELKPPPRPMRPRHWF